MIRTACLALLLQACALTAQKPPEQLPPDPELPIVLVHGMAGFDKLAGVDYFYKVADSLRERGYPVVTTVVDPLAGIEHRARQLAPQIDRILAQTGARKVHLIAHSQGGLDARYLISRLGYANRVASLTTISTPHRGSPVADLMTAPTLKTAVAGAAGMAAWLLESPVDLRQQLKDLSAARLADFNRETPDAPGVRYYSYAGLTQASPLVDLHQQDLVNPLFLATYLLVKDAQGPNDGLVSVESARWGTFLGTLPADHCDEIGLPPGGQLAFDHLAFYRQLADFLEGHGPPARFEVRQAAAP